MWFCGKEICGGINRNMMTPIYLERNNLFEIEQSFVLVEHSRPASCINIRCKLDIYMTHGAIEMSGNIFFAFGALSPSIFDLLEKTCEVYNHTRIHNTKSKTRSFYDV